MLRSWIEFESSSESFVIGVMVELDDFDGLLFFTFSVLFACFLWAVGGGSFSLITLASFLLQFIRLLLSLVKNLSPCLFSPSRSSYFLSGLSSSLLPIRIPVSRCGNLPTPADEASKGPIALHMTLSVWTSQFV